MKKFLTVLLVIAVMFTFSFGSAFALPSDSTDPEYANVAEAQKDAIDDIEDYAKLSDYVAYGQAELLKLVEDAKADVKEATSTVAIKGIVKEFKSDVDDLEEYLRANVTLTEAAEKAEAQAQDYRLGKGSLYDILVGDGAVYEDATSAKAYEAACKKLDAAYAEFEGVIEAAKNGVGTVAGIEAALDKLAVAANAVGREFFAEGADPALQAAIKALVEEIEAKADEYAVNTGKYSDTIMDKYEAATKAGVKAAKAAKNWDELVDVYEEYIGGTVSAAYEVEEGGYEVVITREATSVFAKLAAMTKGREVEMAAAQEVLDTLGAYDYHDVLLGWWGTYEYELDEMEELAEGSAPDEDSVAYIIVEKLNRNSTKKEIAAVVDEVVDIFKELQTVAVAKAEIVAEDGPIEEMVADFIENNTYPQKNETELINLGKLAKTEIKAAADLEEMVEILVEYYVLMDSIPTQADIDAEEAEKDALEAIEDAYQDALADAKKADKDFALTADAQKFVDRVLELAKEDAVANQAKFESKIAEVLEKAAWKNATDEFKGWFRPDFEGDYTEKDGHYVAIVELDFDAAADDAESWADYFKAVDAAEKALEAYELRVVAEFKAAVADAKEAIDELPLVKAEAELEGFEKAMEEEVAPALGVLADAVEELVQSGEATLEDLAKEYINDVVKYALKLYDKVFEAAYVEYLADLEEDGESPSDSAEDFYAIAEDMTDLMSNYSAAAQKEISTIITDAYKALRATKVVAEMDKIAEKAIADLEAVKEKTGDNSDYLAILEEGKAEAAKYFEKYYGAKFESDAETHLQLAYDIMDMQEDFATVEAQIEAVEGLKITAGSTAKKGSITVKWTVKGDASKIDGYQVWKSTKKNSGFKKITAKTTKTQITNKKGLKAGTRYYYKVRAFQVIEGKYYYSDWSNKAYRKAK